MYVSRGSGRIPELELSEKTSPNQVRRNAKRAKNKEKNLECSFKQQKKQKKTLNCQRRPRRESPKDGSCQRGVDKS